MPHDGAEGPVNQVLGGSLARSLAGSARQPVLLRRISCQYLNAFSAGLLVAVGVSVLANFGHKNILLMPKLGRMRPNSDSAQQANYSFDCSLRKSASES